LLPKLGPYRTGTIQSTLLDQLWPCRETGNWFNIARRIPALYQLPTTNPSLPEAFVNADVAILSISHVAGLNVLDHDEEVRKYRGYYADFHPRIERICEYEVPTIQRTQVDRLVIHTNPGGRRMLGEVCLLPRNMTSFYLGMYQAEVSRLKAEIQQLQMQASATSSAAQQASIASQIAADQAAISALEPKIEQLEQFQARIGPWEREVLTR
jgi:hypothetical protein